MLILFCCVNLLLEAYQLYSEVGMNKYFYFRFVKLLKMYMYGISRLKVLRTTPPPSYTSSRFQARVGTAWSVTRSDISPLDYPIQGCDLFSTSLWWQGWRSGESARLPPMHVSRVRFPDPSSYALVVKWPCTPWVLVAQWVEHLPGEVREVMGSIPVTLLSCWLIHLHKIIHYRTQNSSISSTYQLFSCYFFSAGCTLTLLISWKCRPTWQHLSPFYQQSPALTTHGRGCSES